MLRKQIRLVKVVSAQDNKGDFKETETKYNLFADVTSSSNGRGTNGLVDTKSFRVRFRPDFKPTGDWRIIYNGVSYKVGSINQDSEDRFFWTFQASG